MDVIFTSTISLDIQWFQVSKQAYPRFLPSHASSVTFAVAHSMSLLWIFLQKIEHTCLFHVVPRVHGGAAEEKTGLVVPYG